MDTERNENKPLMKPEESRESHIHVLRDGTSAAHSHDHAHDHDHIQDGGHAQAQDNGHAHTQDGGHAQAQDNGHAHTQGSGHAQAQDNGHAHIHGSAHAHSHAHGSGHTHRNTKAVVNRLARAIGHLEKVKRMVEEGYDCSEVLIQLSAVRSALTGTGKLILKDHMEHCIVDAVQCGDMEAVTELSRAIDQFIK